jgi:hypothetical protein
MPTASGVPVAVELSELKRTRSSEVLAVKVRLSGMTPGDYPADTDAPLRADTRRPWEIQPERSQATCRSAGSEKLMFCSALRR